MKDPPKNQPKSLTDTFKSVYYNPANAGAYCGLEPFVINVHKILGKTHSLKTIRKQAKLWLKSQDTYTLHRPHRRNFVRNPIVVYGIDDQWQADLVDMQQWRNENRGIAHLLTCIDIFSKYAWVRALKSKSSICITQAFSSIFSEGRTPMRIQTDKGKEFLNKAVQNLFKQHDVQHFTTENETKAAVVERFNRTLKMRMWRYFSEMGNHQYHDVLQKFTSAYNNAKHRTIGMPPAYVTAEHELQLWNKMYKKTHPPSMLKFTAGTQVRLSKLKWPFEKGYLPNWTDEVFIIDKCIKMSPKPLYKLKDVDGEEVRGSFYEDELQEVYKDLNVDEFEVERILDHRRNQFTNEPEVLVKWKGWPDKFNQWIAASNVNNGS